MYVFDMSKDELNPSKRFLQVRFYEKNVTNKYMGRERGQRKNK